MIEIRKYNIENIKEVIDFEKAIRLEEPNTYFWDIDEEYEKRVEKSFRLENKENSISLLAYSADKVVGRIDASLTQTHFDGTLNCYLDWICVLKSYRHQGVGRKLIASLREELKKVGTDNLVAIVAGNEESQKFYKSIEGATIGDVGIFIKCK